MHLRNFLFVPVMASTGNKKKQFLTRCQKCLSYTHYEQFAGWQTDITKIRDNASLPQAMKNYIAFINDYLGVDVSYISNGPERDQIIKA